MQLKIIIMLIQQLFLISVKWERTFGTENVLYVFDFAEKIWSDFWVPELVTKKKKKMIFLLTEEIVFLYMIPVYYTIYDITGKTMRFAVRSNSVCSLSVSYWLSNVEQII